MLFVHKRLVKILVAALLLVFGLLASHIFVYRVGIKLGQSSALNGVYSGVHRANHWVALGETLSNYSSHIGFRIPFLHESLQPFTFHSQWGQDRWVVLSVFPGVKDGYFVDIGSADGILFSNTKTLEDLGWKGLCIDPFPTNVEARNCKIFRDVVYSSAGHEVAFRQAGSLGGIEEHLGRWSKHDSVMGTSVVKLTTTTMNELLERANAPNYLHYVSLDVEGAEYEVLRGWDLTKYDVGAFTIEHNFEEPKRTEIRRHLEQYGYRLARCAMYDDWYLPQ